MSQDGSEGNGIRVHRRGKVVRDGLKPKELSLSNALPRATFVETGVHLNGAVVKSLFMSPSGSCASNFVVGDLSPAERRSLARETETLRGSTKSRARHNRALFLGES